MNKSVERLTRQTDLLVLILFLQTALLFTIAFDVSFARQVLGFVYLTFVPGLVILRLLRLKLGGLETALFAVGLSIAFLMGEGFLLNLFGPMVGVSEPLGLSPVLVVTGVFVLVSLLLRVRDHYELIGLHMSNRQMTAAAGLILGGILILSVYGARLSTVSSSAHIFVLFLMLTAIAILVGLVAFFGKVVPSNLYPIILFVVALALLLQVSLFSNYIVGGDIYGEYALFKNTFSNLDWNSNLAFTYNAMLSVTILPTIYSVVLRMDGTWVFKIIYPLIFAIVPVGLYLFFRNRFNREVAFVSVFFFVSNITFFTELLQLARQMIGELFYVLLLVTMFSSNLKGSAKWLLFAVFSFGLVVSHYSLSYIFLAFVFVVWLVGFLRKRQTKITDGMVVLFAVLTFAWFIYISSAAAFNNLLLAVTSVRDHLFSDFFNPQSRGGQVLQAVGASGIPTFWHTVGRYQYYVTEVLVIIGFLGLVIKKRGSFFNDEFNVFVLCNSLLLGACIVLPNFAGTFTVSRFYHVTLFFLAPLCILGGIDVLRLLSRNKVKEKYLALIVVLIVLIPYFFFQTGFVYEIGKEDSYSLALSAYRFDSMKLAHMGVLTDPEVYGAVWLSKFGSTTSPVYADIYSGSVFSYVGGVNLIVLSQNIPVTSGSYVYLLQYNIYDGIVFNNYDSVGGFNVTKIAPSLDTMNIIYSGGSCEIYLVPT